MQNYKKKFKEAKEYKVDLFPHPLFQSVVSGLWTGKQHTESMGSKDDLAPVQFTAYLLITY